MYKNLNEIQKHKVDELCEKYYNEYEDYCIDCVVKRNSIKSIEDYIVCYYLGVF